jgi:hypothetical protein
MDSKEQRECTKDNHICGLDLASSHSRSQFYSVLAEHSTPIELFLIDNKNNSKIPYDIIKY